jgi:hypothetical protein
MHLVKPGANVDVVDVVVIDVVAVVFVKFSAGVGKFSTGSKPGRDRPLQSLTSCQEVVPMRRSCIFHFGAEHAVEYCPSNHIMSSTVSRAPMNWKDEGPLPCSINNTLSVMISFNKLFVFGSVHISPTCNTYSTDA